MSDVQAADFLASRLSRWQILDIVYIARVGRMGVCSKSAAGPVLSLVSKRVLDYGAGMYVMPGPRFKAVCEALERLGLVGSVRGIPAEA